MLIKQGSFSPHSQQIRITTTKQVKFLTFTILLINHSARCIKLKHQITALFISNPTLDPAHNNDSLPREHGLNPVKKCTGIKNHRASRQSVRLGTSWILKNKGATLIITLLTKPYREGKICSTWAHVSIIDMLSIALTYP